MLRKIQRAQLLSKFPLQAVTHLTRTVTQDAPQTREEAIIIPSYIERGPTDILKALASTVKRDPTAAHYKYHDDPYLTPVSVTSKRAYAMAQEAGRKAAKWIREEHRDLFQHRVAEPFIDAFAPKEKFTDETVVTEDVLKKLIERSQVENAWKAYNTLKSNKTAISEETKQSLLELLCYYNGEDPLDEEMIEERWYKAGIKGKDRPRKLWKDSAAAEKLFQDMEYPTAESYCALIRGMSMYGQAEGAWQLYTEMQSENRKLDEETFNYVIKVAAAVKESSDTKWQIICDVLKHMASQGVSPSVRTLNSVLEAVSTIPMYRISRKHALDAVAEFHSAGIEPCLATYYHLLNIFYKEKGPVNNILPEIISRLENSAPQLEDPKDVFFLSRAMEVCEFLNDINLAKRVHGLASRPEYKHFIGDSFKESAYYRHYMNLLSRTELPDNLMEVYNSLVPNIYTPEPSVFEAVVKCLEEHGAANHVPQLWSDAVYFEIANRETILAPLVKALASGPGPSQAHDSTNDEADPVLSTAKAIFTHIEDVIKNSQEEGQMSNLRWSGGVLGELLRIFLQYNDFKSASAIISKLNQQSSYITGFVPASVLNIFVKSAVENKSTADALMAVNYAHEMGFSEVEPMAQLIADKLPLDEKQKLKLSSLAGRDLFKMH